jgi:hypothetical protein
VGVKNVPVPKPTQNMIFYAMQRIFCSDAFSRQKKQKVLLKTIVKHTLAGKPATQGVLMREVWPERQDTHIVSSTAADLRRQIAIYYDSPEATDDPVRITVPRVEREGDGYAANFSFSDELLVSRYQFETRLYHYYDIPFDLSGRWFEDGDDASLETTIDGHIRRCFTLLGYR